MSKVTKILNNSVEKTLKDLAKDARDGRLTYLHMLAQYEDEEYEGEGEGKGEGEAIEAVKSAEAQGTEKMGLAQAISKISV